MNIRHPRHRRILFVCKRRFSYGDEYHHDPHPHGPRLLSSGLYNSAKFTADLVASLGIPVRLVDVVDNNDIDREVTAFRPTDVFIEALWVVPSKFDTLKRLHPAVHWIVRNHSEIPFLATEGVAIEWLIGYLKRGIEINCNSERAAFDMRLLAHNIGGDDFTDQVTYLPNYYPLIKYKARVPKPPVEDGIIHIGCFGAIRPLKNHLSQAIAAMGFADSIGQRLGFHVNVTRIEGGAANHLKNLRALFTASPHYLIEHPWLSHPDFLKLLEDGIDIAMQVSFSETFNIVTADAIASGVPVLVSPEISWLEDYAHVPPTDVFSMVRGLMEIQKSDRRARLRAQSGDLQAYRLMAEDLWGARFIV